MSDKDLFLNRLRSLFNIDAHMLPDLAFEDQQKFLSDPPRYFIHADDETADAIWRAVILKTRSGEGGKS